MFQRRYEKLHQKYGNASPTSGAKKSRAKTFRHFGNGSVASVHPSAAPLTENLDSFKQKLNGVYSNGHMQPQNGLHYPDSAPKKCQMVVTTNSGSPVPSEHPLLKDRLASLV